MNKVILWVCVLFASVILVGCGNSATTTDTTDTQEKSAPVITNPDTVEQGDVIKINYVGSSEETGVFDTSLEEQAKEAGTFNPNRNYEPLEFTVGEWMMIPWMETGVVGMKINESKTLTIAPENAYGEWTEDRVQEIPLSNFEEAGIKPTEGEMFNFWIAQWKVLEIGEENVKLDFNNPLAGKTLTFEVTVTDIVKAAIVQ